MARSTWEQAVVRRLIPNDAEVWRVQRLAQHVGRFSARGHHFALLADMVIVECKRVRMAGQVSTVNDRLPKIFTSVLERQLKCADAAGCEVCGTDLGVDRGIPDGDVVARHGPVVSCSVVQCS